MQSLYNRENHEKRSAIGEWRRQHLHGSLSSESLRTALAAPTVILRWITAPPPPEHILIAASQMLVRAEHDDDDDDDDHWMASQLSSAGSANLRPLDPATDEADMADSASTSVRSNAAAGPLASPLDVGQLSQQDAGLLIRALADVLRSEEAPLVFRVSAVRALARHAVDAHEADDATSFDASTGAAATSASAAAAPDADAEEMIEAARADEPLAPIDEQLVEFLVRVEAASLHIARCWRWSARGRCSARRARIRCSTRGGSCAPSESRFLPADICAKLSQQVLELRHVRGADVDFLGEAVDGTRRSRCRA